jgi:hypothetical protein
VITAPKTEPWVLKASATAIISTTYIQAITTKYIYFFSSF